MKKLLLMFLLLPFLYSCGEDKKNDLQRLNLNGNVKSVTNREGDLLENFGELVGKDLKKTDVKIYNNKGNITEDTIFGEGTLGNQVFKYDDKDNRTITNTYVQGSLAARLIYEFDDKGFRKERNQYGFDGSLQEKVKYKYNDKGNEIECYVYGRDGRFIYKDKSKYDDRGNLIEDDHYDRDGNFMYTKKYNYDDRGNLTESYSFNFDGSLDSKLTYEYDKFDEFENWTTRASYKDDLPYLFKERIIEYY